jgi:hypothetical protein
MLRRPNDEKNAFDEQVWPDIKPARRIVALDASRTARHNLKYPSIMPQPRR